MIPEGLSWFAAVVLLGQSLHGACARPVADAASEAEVRTFGVSCAGTRIAILRQGHVEVWDLASTGRPRTIRASEAVWGERGYLAYDPDGTAVSWCPCELETCTTIGPTAGALSAMPAVAGDLAFLPISGGQSVEVWDVAKRVRVVTLQYPPGQPLSRHRFGEIVPSDDGRYVLSDYEPWIWESATGRIVATTNLEDPGEQRWEPGGHRVLLLNRSDPGLAEVLDPIAKTTVPLAATFPSGRRT